MGLTGTCQRCGGELRPRDDVPGGFGRVVPYCGPACLQEARFQWWKDRLEEYRSKHPNGPGPNAPPFTAPPPMRRDGG